MLTELDHCILGVISREGPMSAYDVRTHFARSTTVAWSSSTGTVYPAIRRLRRADLVTATEPLGPRRAALLSITNDGLSAVRNWLRKPSPELGSPTADPVRGRLQFLALLSDEQQQKAIADYRVATERSLADLKSMIDRLARDRSDPFEQLGARGALMQLEARLSWLEIAAKHVASRAS